MDGDHRFPLPGDLPRAPERPDFGARALGDGANITAVVLPLHLQQPQDHQVGLSVSAQGEPTIEPSLLHDRGHLRPVQCGRPQAGARDQAEGERGGALCVEQPKVSPGAHRAAGARAARPNLNIDGCGRSHRAHFAHR